MSRLPDEWVLTGVVETGERLGGGAYGSVFAGTLNGSRVAVKRLHQTFMGLDRHNKPSEEFQKFLKEFPMLCKFAHPAVVQVFGMAPPSTSQGSHGVVMELLRISLRERYSQQPYLSSKEEIRILENVASGIDYLHSKNVLHRDITTTNVMLTNAGVESHGVLAKIVDVGIARSLDDVTKDAGGMTMAPGHPSYMAPETYSDSSDQMVSYGRPSDIYAIGVTAMAMLNRREPPSIRALFNGEGRAKDISDMESSHPLCIVVQECVRNSPDGRPSASQLYERLSAIQDIHATVVANTQVASGDAAGNDQKLADVEHKLQGVIADLVHVSTVRDGIAQRLKATTLEKNRVTQELVAVAAERDHVTGELQAAMMERDRVTGEREVSVMERNRVIGELEAAVTQRDAVTEQRETAVAERGRVAGELQAALTERDRVIGELETAVTQRDTVTEQRETAVAEQGRMAGELQAALTERDRVIGELETAVMQRDAVAEQRETAVAERGRMAGELQAALTERDRVIGELETAVMQRDAVAEQRETAVAERGRMAGELQAALTERDRVIGELEAAVTQRDAVTEQREMAVAERGRMAGELQAALTERDHVIGELETAVTQRDAVTEQCETAVAERGRMAGELQAALTERDRVIGELEAAVTQRDAVTEQREMAVAERGRMAGELQAALTERDHVIGELETAVTQRDAVTEQCETAVAERGRMAGELQAALTERDRVTGELETAVVQKDNVTEQLEAAVAERGRMAGGLETAVAELTQYRDTATVEIARLTQNYDNQVVNNQRLVADNQRLVAEVAELQRQRYISATRLREEQLRQPAMQQIVRDSQKPAPSGNFSFDSGKFARCQRLFAANGIAPIMNRMPKWEIQTRENLDGVKSIIHHPVVHDNYIYQLYRMSRDENRPFLYRVNVGPVDRIEAWQQVALPDQHPDGTCNWDRYSALLFSYSGRLHCILHPASLTGFARIFSLDQFQQWRQVTCLPVKLFHFGVCVVDSTLYVVGGRGTPRVQSPMLPTVHTCDLSGDVPQWDSVPVPDLPYGLTFPEVVTLGSHIHVLGYCAEETENEKKVISMDMSEPVCDRHWSCDTLPGIPNKWCMAVVMNDHLVVLGGLDATGHDSRSTYLYVPECQRYLDLPSFNSSWNSYPPCVAHNNKLYISQGSTSLLECLSV